MRPRFHILLYYFFVLMISVIQSGCGSPRIDQQSPYLMHKPPEPFIPTDYLIGKSDDLEVMYYLDPEQSVQKYFIDTEDTLLIDFYYYPTLNKTARVRPDGFITLKKIGDIKAAGYTTQELAGIISKGYISFLSRPNVTVEAINFNVKLENLKAAIQTTTRGQSKRVVVRSDGKISLPYINDIRAEGLTCLELNQRLQTCYRKFVKNISITTAILNANSNLAYILGEVKNPNSYELKRSQTITQFIAGAGGFLQRADTHQIILIRRGKDGQPEANLIDMDDVIGKGDISYDIILRQYDVIYVPKASLSQAALIMDDVWSIIPLGFSGAYSLGGTNLR